MGLAQRLMELGDPRWHGNGFTQLDLNARQRLHVWHPDWGVNPRHVSTVHDHVFDLTSEVLLGKVGHEAFEAIPVDASGNWKVYRIDGWKDGRRDFEGVDPQHVYVGQCVRRSLGSYLIPAGGQYSFPRRQFHESSAEGLTATLMTKSNEVDPSDKPRVLCPWGDESTDARSMPGGPGVDGMWAIIEEALRKMWGSSRSRIEACLL